ncbi:MAG: hypothetical protein DMG05_00865 [Acidobacteria bacterium]|nr:MAG: hypothetical protein DMG05_00865 [Acidobacteriota bacterium]
MEQLSLYLPIPYGMKSHPAKWRLLVVDDEIGMAESLRMLLSRLGYEVSIANSGEMALQELGCKPFDLIITDLVMEGLNGYDILDFVDREQLNIPVIVLTGLGSVDAAVKALKHGAYDYILKPFDLDSFKVSIRRAIEKRQLETMQRIQNRRISAVASIAKAVSSTLRLDEIFQIIINQTREFVDFDNAALALVAPQELFLDLFAVVLDHKLSPHSRERFSLEQPPFSSLALKQIPVIVSDVSNDQEMKAIDSNLLEGIRSCTLVPLISKDQLVGILFFGSRVPFGYNQQDLEFLSPIADQTAVAVDNARLLELELRRSRQLEIINHIGKQLNSSLVAEKLLTKAIYLLSDYFQYRYIDIFCFDESKSSLIRTKYHEYDLFSDLKPARLRIEEGIVGRVARTGQTILLNNVRSDPGYVKAFEDTSVELAVPLKSQGEIYGVLNIEETASHKFTEDERIVIEAVASQISLALKNARLFEQIRKSKIYLELVLNSAENTSIISIDQNGKIITFNSGSERLLGLSATEAVRKEVSEVIQSKRVRSVLKTLNKKNKREGWEDELKISRPDKQSFWAHIIIRPIEPAADLFVGFLIILTDVTPRVELESKLKQLTVTDDLTGLYNQRYFFEQLKREMERASRRSTCFSLCIFDLDKFKTYNDTYGHFVGDKILKSVGAIVSKTIRARIDTAFRYGGDEFILLLPDTRLEEAASLVERLRKAISKEFKGQISISAGIVEYTHNMEEKEFVESADKLMYLAKRKGGDRVVFEMEKFSHS